MPRALSFSFALTASLVVLAGAQAGPARAEGVTLSRDEVLRSFFPSSEKVTYVKLTTADHAETLKRQLGYVPVRDTYVIFVAKTGDTVDGYALIDDEKGQHMPITFAVQLGPDGKVRRTEVMAYREAYGDEIREPRFRAQFEGKGEADLAHPGDDVAAITGATISSRAATVAVRRAIALVAVVRAQGAGAGKP